MYTELVGALLFTLSLNFKHMALYYAPAFFFFLLHGCLVDNTASITKRRAPLAFFSAIIKLGLVVICTCGVLWAPFCMPSAFTEAYKESNACEAEDHLCIQNLGQVLKRLFPIGRGLFEDKVRINLYLAASYYMHYDSLSIRVILTVRVLCKSPTQVANLWCSLDTLLKIRRKIPAHFLPALALALTLR
jgi:ALG6, ALG8 glycosyltransferase family